MRPLVIILLIYSAFAKAQVSLSAGFDPKMLFVGSDNEDTNHGTGLDYYGTISVKLYDNIEAVGTIEVFDKIGYRGLGLGAHYILPIGRFDLVAGLETTVISRYEIVDRNKDGSILNDRWQEYLPSFGVNGEIRLKVNNWLAIGWLANYKTRPDLPNKYGRFSTYTRLIFTIGN